MPRIYVVTAKNGGAERYVRANTLNAAVRAVADENFVAAAATTEQMYQAMGAGSKVLDAVAPAQMDIEKDEDAA